jgi:hypothetical protein
MTVLVTPVAALSRRLASVAMTVRVTPVAALTRRLASVAMTALALSFLLCGADEARAGSVRVSVDPSRAGPPVPDRFVGLSFEAAALPAIARGASRGNLVTLLRSLGRGVLRFGGFTSETNTAFSVHREAPAWATTTIGPADLARLATLARRTGWRVMLTLPLGHYDPRAAAREAAVAVRLLGPALAAFQIGNEPNGFSLLGLRPPTYDYAQYRSEFRSYRRAIASTAPGVPIAGPDTVQWPDGWLNAFALGERPPLLTPHFYAMTGCTHPAPTIADLLGPAVARSEAETIAGFAAIPRAQRLPMRLAESNNISCAGQAGVSDTFAAALWALRYMLISARLGITGVNFHTLPDHCAGYSPVCAQSRAAYRQGRLRAMPEWYALLLFHQLASKQPVRASLSAQSPGLTADVFGGGSARSIDVLAVNTTPDDAALTIRVAGHRALRSATMLALTAPALRARAGIRLGGATVSRRGAWRPARRLPTVPARAGGDVAVAGRSAALIRLNW